MHFPRGCRSTRWRSCFVGRHRNGTWKAFDLRVNWKSVISRIHCKFAELGILYESIMLENWNNFKFTEASLYLHESLNRRDFLQPPFLFRRRAIYWSNSQTKYRFSTFQRFLFARLSKSNLSAGVWYRYSSTNQARDVVHHRCGPFEGSLIFMSVRYHRSCSKGRLSYPLRQPEISVKLNILSFTLAGRSYSFFRTEKPKEDRLWACKQWPSLIFIVRHKPRNRSRALAVIARERQQNLCKKTVVARQSFNSSRKGARRINQTTKLYCATMWKKNTAMQGWIKFRNKRMFYKCITKLSQEMVDCVDRRVFAIVITQMTRSLHPPRRALHSRISSRLRSSMSIVTDRILFLLQYQRLWSVFGVSP